MPRRKTSRSPKSPAPTSWFPVRYPASQIVPRALLASPHSARHAIAEYVKAVHDVLVSAGLPRELWLCGDGESAADVALLVLEPAPPNAMARLVHFAWGLVPPKAKRHPSLPFDQDYPGWHAGWLLVEAERAVKALEREKAEEAATATARVMLHGNLCLFLAQVHDDAHAGRAVRARGAMGGSKGGVAKGKRYAGRDAALKAKALREWKRTGATRSAIARLLADGDSQGRSAKRIAAIIASEVPATRGPRR